MDTIFQQAELIIFDLDGTLYEDTVHFDYYAQQLKLELSKMIAIGDGWWLPNVCARHYGVMETHTSYERTKEYMATDQFTLTKIPHLRSSLLHLKTKKITVLLTNSQDDDVARLLHLLDLEGTFDDIITVAKKPLHTLNHFSD